MIKRKIFKGILVFFLLSIFFVFINFENKNNSILENYKLNQVVLNIEENNTSENEIENEYNWQIEIPAISLKAEIKEGTSEQVMNKYVAHFSETSITDGNIALVAHNRGYEINYFSDIKDLKIGDEIIYKYREYKKVYKVQKKEVIEDTDWSYIRNTKENVITLITCVENKPEYRRVIRGIEKKEEI